MSRHFFVVIACSLFILAAGKAAAEYPNDPITLVIGFKAGGATDLLGRIIGKGLEEELRVPVIIVNKAGAGGALAYEEIRRAKPDGLTLGWVTGSLFTTTNIGNLEWGYEDIDPVARIAQWPLVVGVRADAPWETWRDFLNAAKKDPGTYKFGHAGTGSIGHLMNVAVSSGAEVIFAPIGADRRFPALLGGQIDLLSAPAAGFVKFAQAGRMRPLVVSSDRRIPLLPDTPTAREIGIDYQVDLMYGVFAPPATPESIKKTLREALQEIIESYKPLLKFVETKKMSLEYLDGPELDEWLGKQNEAVVRIMKEVGLYQSVSPQH
jgi:tripartite-type tricarboxylate transporter receptor subunit TctC